MGTTDSTATGSNSGKGGKGLVVGIVVAVIVILALVGVIIFLVLTKSKDAPAPIAEEQTEERRNVVVTPDNVEEVIEKMNEEQFTEPGFFETSMTNVWHFTNGKATSQDAYVANVVNNTNDVYFDIVLESDESKTIYKSPVIPRGSSLEQIALDTPLEAGTYECVMIYHLVDENQKTISTLRVGITVIIEG
jgi:hypothetical protein